MDTIQNVNPTKYSHPAEAPSEAPAAPSQGGWGMYGVAKGIGNTVWSLLNWRAKEDIITQELAARVNRVDTLRITSIGDIQKYANTAVARLILDMPITSDGHIQDIVDRFHSIGKIELPPQAQETIAQLDAFHIQGEKFTDAIVCSVIPYLRNLKALHMINCPTLTDATCRSLGQHPTLQLTSLLISGHKGNNMTAGSFVALRPICRQLENLYVENMGPEAQEYLYVMLDPSVCPTNTLRQLGITSSSSLTGDMLFSELRIQNIQTLQSLSLYGCPHVEGERIRQFQTQRPDVQVSYSN